MCVCVPSGSRRDPLEPLRCRLSIPFQRRSRVGVEGANPRERVLRERANRLAYFVTLAQRLDGTDDLLGRKVRLDLGNAGLRG